MRAGRNGAATALLVSVAIAGCTSTSTTPSQTHVPTLTATPSASPTPPPTLWPSPTLAQGPVGFTETGHMATWRAFHTATLLQDGRVLVVGGLNSSGTTGTGPDLASAEIYDPSTGKFNPTGSMGQAREGHTATLLQDGRVLVAGGYSTSTGGVRQDLASAELYDPVTGTFSPTGPMAQERTDDTATLLPNGKVLIAGGTSPLLAGDFVMLATAELYDPATGKFSATGSMVQARADQTATPLPDGHILVTGGWVWTKGGDGTWTQKTVPLAELYDPATGTFSSTGSMVHSRVGAVATLLGDGRVLVIGGQTYPGGGLAVGASAELYDPATGKFTPTGSMARSRGFRGASIFTATLLLDGRVLVAGGDDSNGNDPLRSAELYDPKTGRFSATTPLVTGRLCQTATILPDGRVLLVGGFQVASTVSLWSAELYQP